MPASPRIVAMRPSTDAAACASESRAREASPADHGQLGRSAGVSGRRGGLHHGRRSGRGDGRREPLVADRLVQLGRLGERLHPELALERGDGRPVEADRPGPIPAPREDRHEPPPGGLIEGIELHQPRGGIRGGPDVALGLGEARQPLQHVRRPAAPP